MVKAKMGFTLEEFARKRPYLFHLTASSNLERPLGSLTLLSAQQLLEKSGTARWLTEKRQEHVKVKIRNREISIRDQAPLHAGNMALENGWIFERFLQQLNDRVFFWPGRTDGKPIDYGRRHFDRYAEEIPVLLRVPTLDVFKFNRDVIPEFCRYNSGSPRWTYGKASPRGSETFVRANNANFSASQTVEVTFLQRVRLPRTTQRAHSPDGPWSSLFGL